MTMPVPWIKEARREVRWKSSEATSLEAQEPPMSTGKSRHILRQILTQTDKTTGVASVSQKNPKHD